MKTTPNNLMRNFIGASIAVHVIALTVWFSNFDTNIEKSMSHSIKISLTKFEPKSAAPQKHNKNNSKINNTTVKNTIEKHSKVTNSHNMQQQRITRSSNSEKPDILEQSETGTRTSPILNKLLFQAINNQKQYPRSALRMRQEGSVRISFDLRKNGSIDKLAIHQSSGSHALDKAAVNAVKNIQPFTLAEKYITSMESFTLNIQFKL